MSKRPRDEAIGLANRYKEIERRIPGASPGQIDQLRREAARIAARLNELGYSLPRLIMRRYQRDQQSKRQKP